MSYEQKVRLLSEFARSGIFTCEMCWCTNYGIDPGRQLCREMREIGACPRGCVLTRREKRELGYEDET